MNKTGIICLLTDFGLRDGYVGAMKGVIISIASHVTVIDISHEIDPFCVASGAYVLASVVPYFPPGTIFVAVVDPGVGTERKGLIVRSSDKIFIGPDNGIFSWILDPESSEIFWIDPEGSSAPYVNSKVSSTFHGRDIFAPIAAHIVNGIPPEKLSVPAANAPVTGEWRYPQADEKSIRGCVIHVDRFGNLVTNITKNFYLSWKTHHFPKTFSPQSPIVEIKSNLMHIEKTYGSVPKGHLLALWGSSDHLEISVNEGNAAEKLSVGCLEEVRIRMS
ncbi:MAG: SAM-dependent chlorinase/fluorinase [Thermodesulforhabdaceae bacterium]